MRPGSVGSGTDGSRRGLPPRRGLSPALRKSRRSIAASLPRLGGAATVFELVREEPALAFDAAAVPADRTVGPHDPMARHNDADRVRRVRRADRADAPGAPISRAMSTYEAVSPAGIRAGPTRPRCWKVVPSAATRTVDDRVDVAVEVLPEHASARRSSSRRSPVTSTNRASRTTPSAATPRNQPMGVAICTTSMRPFYARRTGRIRTRS